MATHEHQVDVTQPVQLYGWNNSPVRVNIDDVGNLYVIDKQGMVIPYHDEQVIDESDANNVTITYKLAGVQVAVKTIVISGTTTTITVV